MTGIVQSRDDAALLFSDGTSLEKKPPARHYAKGILRNMEHFDTVQWRAFRLATRPAETLSGAVNFDHTSTGDAPTRDVLQRRAQWVGDPCDQLTPSAPGKHGLDGAIVAARLSSERGFMDWGRHRTIERASYSPGTRRCL
jgi:hypothetical protein